MWSGRSADTETPTPGRPGPALVALGVILVVTAAWWALALAPVAGQAPEWLARTRLACFGAPPGGLPDAGGWILLVGEPVGMLAVLLAVWRDALWRDLSAVAVRPAGRITLAAVGLLLGWGTVSAAAIVRRGGGESFTVDDVTAGGGPVTLDTVPLLVLTDQHGAEVDLARVAADGPVLVTFAFAHCADVCPTLVRTVLRTRESAARPDVPLLVVTVDPWRDTPSRLAGMASGWGLLPADRVLGGSVDEVNTALDAWHVGRVRDPATGDVSHAAVVVLVAAGGRTAVRLAGPSTSLEGLLRGA